MAEKGECPDAPAETEAQQASPAPQAAPPIDSVSFLRCSSCRHAKEVDVAAGTLLCDKHNMHINAEMDEIPDDCVEHEPTAG